MPDGGAGAGRDGAALLLAAHRCERHAKSPRRARPGGGLHQRRSALRPEADRHDRGAFPAAYLFRRCDPRRERLECPRGLRALRHARARARRGQRAPVADLGDGEPDQLFLRLRLRLCQQGARSARAQHRRVGVPYPLPAHGNRRRDAHREAGCEGAAGLRRRVRQLHLHRHAGQNAGGGQRRHRALRPAGQQNRPDSAQGIRGSARVRLALRFGRRYPLLRRGAGRRLSAGSLPAGQRADAR